MHPLVIVKTLTIIEKFLFVYSELSQLIEVLNGTGEILVARFVQDFVVCTVSLYLFFFLIFINDVSNVLGLIVVGGWTFQIMFKTVTIVCFDGLAQTKVTYIFNEILFSKTFIGR